MNGRQAFRRESFELIGQMTTIVFDESGNTGANLLDAHQRVFVLASVRSETAEIVRRVCGPNEAKFATLKRSLEGRRKIRAVLDDPQLDPASFVVSAYHKPFVAVTRVVDYLLEPQAHAAGIDMNLNGGNIATANLLVTTGPVFLGQALFDQLLATFVAMIRTPHKSTIDQFYRTVDACHAKAGPDDLKDMMGALRFTRGWVEGNANLGEAALDPAFPSFCQHASHWTEREPNGFDVIHDSSKLIAGQRTRLQSMMSLTDVPQRLGYDRRTYLFPFAAKGIEFQDSKQNAAIQVADIIAGAIGLALNALASGKSDGFAKEVLGIEKLSRDVLALWPDTAVTPEELDTIGPPPDRDPTMVIAEYVRKRET